jgi:hypothetical protein
MAQHGSSRRLRQPSPFNTKHTKEEKDTKDDRLVSQDETTKTLLEQDDVEIHQETHA